MSGIPQVQRKRKLLEQDQPHSEAPASKRAAVDSASNAPAPSPAIAASPIVTDPATTEKPPSLKEIMRMHVKQERGRDRAQNGATLSANTVKMVAVDKFGETRQEGGQSAARPAGLNLQLVLDADGKVSFAPESMVLDRMPETYEVTEITDVVESGRSRRVTSASYTKRSANTPWTSSEIDEFYRALRKCGTNFLMIASMLPGRDRNQVLRLYKKEQKMHPERILYATTHPMVITQEDIPVAIAPERVAAPTENAAVVENGESVSGLDGAAPDTEQDGDRAHDDDDESHLKDDSIAEEIDLAE
eukprot:TRINITY_DN1158_c0_g1_i2.p1 TRINITY_DN1158_c0_g1~~TRINITY_DN1158_c0_g1_i2.p1  ORF type:complete len:303 (+),score=60.25 TRINITY_DN1158_c0_g1_i2:81-989(+)